MKRKHKIFLPDPYFDRWVGIAAKILKEHIDREMLGWVCTSYYGYVMLDDPRIRLLPLFLGSC